ncbi:MAG: HAD family phosphatase [Patescibacteria group bacterium]
MRQKPRSSVSFSGQTVEGLKEGGKLQTRMFRQTMKITIIIFDLGNTVLTNDWHVPQHRLEKAFVEYFNISMENMENAWHKCWPRFSLGKMTEEEFWQDFLRQAGAENIGILQARKIWSSHQKPIESMLDLLVKLKQNYKLAALTTISREWLDYKIQKFELNKYFDVIVSSGYSGFGKDNPRIYDLIIDKLGVNPENCLLIDDSEAVIELAHKKNIQTILFTGQRNLETKLEKMGVKF